VTPRPATGPMDLRPGNLRACRGAVASVASWQPVLVGAVAAVLGLLLLSSIGTAQWFVLRHHVARASRWIWATAAAWLAGLAVFLGFAMPLWQPGQAVALTVGIGVAGGLLMAATVASITGGMQRRLLS